MDPRAWKTSRKGKPVSLLADRRLIDRYQPALAAGLELHRARTRREDRVVAADANSGARLEARATLAHDDLATGDPLTREHLHAEALGLGVAAVPARSESLLVC